MLQDYNLPNTYTHVMEQYLLESKAGQLEAFLEGGRWETTNNLKITLTKMP